MQVSWALFWAKVRKTNWQLVVGLVGLGLLLFLAVFGQYLAPYDPLQGHKGIKVAGQRLPPYPPSDMFRLGTDRLGRDVLSGILAGARYTLFFTGIALVVGLLLAIPIGMLAGWRGGTTGAIIETMSGGVAAVPQLLLVGFALRALRGPALEQAVMVQAVGSALILGVLIAVRLADVVRRLTIQVKAEPYVEAAIASGASTPRIMFNHLLRNIAPAVGTAGLVEYAGLLRLLAVLALVQISIVPYMLIDIPYFPWFEPHPIFPEWTTYMTMPYADMDMCYWVLLYPGLAITWAILTFNLLAEGLRRKWRYLGV